jgi:molybdopterin molybdotransferase
MNSVSEAENIIFSCLPPTPKQEQIALKDASGRILQENLHADRDFPPFHRVTMDGIAILFSAWAAGQRVFRVTGMAPAGRPVVPLEESSGCIEVMTGAMLPPGTDTVIRYEDITLANGVAQVAEVAVQQGQNIHYQGSDRKKGDLILPAGCKIGPAEMGVAATLGRAQVLVSALPRIALVATGDELVPVEATPLPHQIRMSNVWSVQALLQEQAQCSGTVFYFPDDAEGLRRGLRVILDEYEVVILSGAVSEGKFDHLPVILQESGVEKRFHKVSQRPGKPFWFGTFGQQGIVFALPGNPVSTFLCALRYVIPFLQKQTGWAKKSQKYAILAEKVIFNPSLTYFLPVKIQYTSDGRLLAFPAPGHGSGDLANLTDADGFLELPADQQHFDTGSVFPFIQYNSP